MWCIIVISVYLNHQRPCGRQQVLTPNLVIEVSSALWPCLLLLLCYPPWIPSPWIQLYGVLHQLGWWAYPSLFHMGYILPFLFFAELAPVEWPDILSVVTLCLYIHIISLKVSHCLQWLVVCILGGEAVVIKCHLIGQCQVCHCQVGDDGVILWCCLYQVGKFLLGSHHVLCSATASVLPLVEGLLKFIQVCLQLDEVCMEVNSYFFVLWLGSQCSAVFLEFYRFCDKAVRDLEDPSFSSALPDFFAYSKYLFSLK